MKSKLYFLAALLTFFLGVSVFSVNAQVTFRNRIIIQADRYYGNVWTASSSNKWKGTLCQTRNVYSAPWVAVGSNVGMPYCWGGWSGLAQHTDAMTRGRSAGDVCSLNGGGCSGKRAVNVSCASGHDCSGLVSRAWETSSKHSTRTLPTISTRINLADVQVGDIVNREGNHTRLIHNVMGNGNLVMIEASGADWKVAYHTYRPAQLVAYRTHVYDNVVETTPPPYCPKPSSVSVYEIGSTFAKVSWTAPGAVAYKYYLKKSTSSTYSLYNNYTYNPVRFTLAPNTTYQFKVVSVCQDSLLSTESDVIEFTTLPSKSSNELFSYSEKYSKEDLEEENTILFEDGKREITFKNPVRTGESLLISGIQNSDKISIYSLDGKLVFNTVYSGNNQNIIIPENIPASIYLLRIDGNLNTTIKRLAVQN